MRTAIRQFTNHVFTLASLAAVLLLLVALVLILSPMLYRGAGAVVFRGTVEFRKMQMAQFSRGHPEALQAEIARTDEARRLWYERLDHFQRGIDTERLMAETRRLYRDFGSQLRTEDTDQEEYARLRSAAKEIRNLLLEAFQSQNRQVIEERIQTVLAYREDPQWQGLLPPEFFTLAEDYRQAVQTIDLERRAQYAEALAEVQTLLRQLLGPGPTEPRPALIMDQYGATRWDLAQKHLHHLLWVEEWVETGPGRPLEKKLTPRAEQFRGTSLEPWFRQMEEELPQMLNPRLTFYWQFFIDDSVAGHYFGGVGPEILGTLLLTVLAMLAAVPLGIVAAGYLVECAGDTPAVRIIRTCINTLAGVPSIVFGLFGLAFYILFLFPRLGLPSKPGILAAGLTLALLVLPVIIRASEEAIRSVPKTYKEASLALGAGEFRTFVKVTLPAALPGILTGIILSLSRAAGETAPILFTGAIALGPLPKSVLDPTRTLSYGSYDLAVGDRLAMLVPHQQYGMVMTLILMVLCLNILAIVLRSRMSRKLRG